MFKKEYKNGIIRLSSHAIDREKVFIGSDNGTMKMMNQDTYDWGYMCTGSLNLTKAMLEEVLSDKSIIPKIAYTVCQLATSQLDHIKFDAKINLREILNHLTVPDYASKLNNASDGKKRVVHAFQFMKINIEEVSKEPYFVSKFLDFSNTAGNRTLFPENTIQTIGYKALVEDGKKEVFESFLKSHKVVTSNILDDTKDCSVEEHTMGSITVHKGTLPEDKAKKLIYEKSELFEVKW